MVILNEVILIHATGGDGLYEEIKSLLQSKKIKVREMRDVSTIELMFGSLRINYMHHEAYQMNQAVGLSSKEFSALWYMASNARQMLTKEQIYEYVYKEEPVEGIDNLIYCLIRSLRKKLEQDPRHPKYIHTVRGAGYKFEPLSGE